MKVQRLVGFVLLVGLWLPMIGLTLDQNLTGSHSSVKAETAALPALVADYQLRGNLNSAVGSSPALANLGNNTFEQASIDDALRIALKFDQNNGVVLSPISSQAYTVVALFSFKTTTGFRRIIEFKNGTSDNGLYCYYGALRFYGANASGASDVIDPNAFVQVVLTRDAAGNVTGYVNGVRQFSFADTTGLAMFDSNNSLRLFRDEAGGGDASEGYLARLRLYSGAMSGADVAGLDRLAHPLEGCPSLSGFSPTTASPGTSVTITGSGLLGVTAVRFTDNLGAAFVVNDDTQLTATVPAGATTGVISLVKANCGEVRTAAVFNVPAVSPPSLVADYRFQDNLRSTVGNPPELISLSSNSFESAPVDDGTRRVLRFGQNNGVALFSTAGLVSNQAYTVVALVSLDMTSGFRRLLDFKNGTTDNGLYSYYGSLRFYGANASGPSDVINPNSYVQVALTRDASGNVNGYVNGTSQFSFADNDGLAAIEGNTLRFFRDETGGSDASAGRLARLRLYNIALSGSQIAALDRLPSPQSNCPSVTVINPASGTLGSTVTITGTNFTGLTTIKFAGNVAAQFNVVSDTQVTVVVPAGASSGAITLSKSNCADAQTTTFTVAQSSRLVSAVCSSGAPGGLVSVPIELAAQGDENALGFSLNFDPAILSNPQAAKGSSASAATLNTNAGQASQGRFGVALALPSSQTFAAGSRQIVVVSFNIAASTTAISTVIDFGDAPIRRQISNVGALSLPANYQGCTSIGLFRGYEADVTPRPSGKNDGTVSITDWVLIGRFVGGLDTPAAGEFQRADCSPRETRGDGQLSVTDWVQAGRYAAGLDAVQTVGGPTAPVSLTASSHEVLASRAKSTARTMRVPSTTFQRGRSNILTVEFEARGDENALGFSLQYDPSLLRFTGANLGDGLGNALLNVNTTQTVAGRVGIVLALPAGQRFAAGAHAFVTVRFDALAGLSSAMTNVEFADQPIRRQTADANANALTVNYAGGIVNVNQPPRRGERQSSN